MVGWLYSRGESSALVGGVFVKFRGGSRSWRGGKGVVRIECLWCWMMWRLNGSEVLASIVFKAQGHW